MVPSFLTPVLMYIRAPARIVVEIVSSALSRTIITGRFALIASSPQIGSMAAPDVMPLPLPPQCAARDTADGSSWFRRLRRPRDRLRPLLFQDRRHERRRGRRRFSFWLRR